MTAHTAVLAHYTALAEEAQRVVINQSPKVADRIPRAELPQFVVHTQTVYLVSGAPTPTRVLRWFADKNDIDLDVETLDFGTVEIIGQREPTGCTP